MMRYKESYFSYLLVLFAYYFATGIFGSILSVYLWGIGKNAGEISFIVSGAHIFAFGIIPMVTYLHDKARNPSAIVRLVLLASAVSGLAFALSRHTWLLFVLNGLSMSLLQSLAPVCERLCSSGKYRYGAVRVWGAIGYAVAAQTAGIVYQHVVPGVLFALFAAALGVTLAEFQGTDEALGGWLEKETAPIENNPLFLKNGRFLLFLSASSIFAGATGLNTTYLPMLLVERGENVSQAASVLFLATLMEIPIILFSGSYMDRFGDKTLLAAAFCILAVQFSLYGFSSAALPVIASCILFKSVSTMLYIMITIKVVANLIDERYTVSALGLTATVKALGSVFFQNAGGRFIEYSGLKSLYLVLIAFSALGLMLSLPLHTQKSKAVFQ